MAATWIKPLHVNKGKSIAQTIAERTDYAGNPDKTDKGELVTGYECDPRTVDAEFLLSKRQYKYITGRDQGRHNVLAYHIRQSFKPGEITAEEANRLGRELAMRWTKGNHAFIVATHIDRSHIHNHIIYNSTTLDCTRKFLDFKGSTFAVRRLSDQICLEHGLSVIDDPKPSRGHYGTWLGEKRQPNFKVRLKLAIDATLEQKPADFDAFIAALEKLGIEVSRRGKHLRLRALADDHGPAQVQYTRCDSLKGDYTEQAIRDRIAGVRQRTPGHSSLPPVGPHVQKDAAPNLLIDIQARMLAGKGAGYERWAKLYNLKEMAKTLIYLQEHNLTQYTTLEEQVASATATFRSLSEQIKTVEGRMAEINELQKHIGNYNRTRQVYQQYKASRYSKSFRAEHEGAILLHQAAKKAFDALGVQKLPGIKALQTEYAKLRTEKKRLYREYRQAREDMRSLQVTKANTDQLLRAVPAPQEQGQQR
ncbi:relaxase/mobilization nuclease domain-containing protein [Ruminococcaceae bacterium OttesenSCG-928-D13]|nr:relaxase/mobilization nuclease domain-containing protein [Ruminococcaceae bacterium OttesenSCG-928-D13]